MSSVPNFSMKDLLEAGVHYGHKTMRWNPKMAPYLYGSRNGTHIIDLQQTVPMLHTALQAVYEVVKNNGRVLFVGTKRQASDIIAESAARCGQYYVNHRWLGGMLTNWKTVSNSIQALRDIEATLSGSAEGLKKKEILGLSRKADKIRRSLGGIMDMGGKPDLLFVIDVNKESLAMHEAKNLGVPVVAVVDSNCSPDGVDYLIPGNDDSVRAIRLYCQLISDAALAGIQYSLGASGVDIGSAAELPKEMLADVIRNDNRHNRVAKNVTGKKAYVSEETAEEDSVKKPTAKKEVVSEVKKAKKPVAKKPACKTEEAKKTKK